MKKLALFASLVMLGALSAGAGTMSVAQFNDGGGATDAQLIPTSLQATFITLKNNTNSSQTYSLIYFSLDGVTNRTPVANTFAIGPNAARVWRPVQTDPNEGQGTSIPNAIPGGGSGTVSILYSESPAPSGIVRVFVGSANTSYSWGLLP